MNLIDFNLRLSHTDIWCVIDISFCLDNTADVWRQELMGLAQQVQSSLQLLDESRSSLLSQRSSKRSSSSLPISYLQDNDESNISKRLLNRHATPQRQHSYIPKLRISIDENEQESSINNKKQDPGIWVILLKINFLS